MRDLSPRQLLFLLEVCGNRPAQLLSLAVAYVCARVWSSGTKRGLPLRCRTVCGAIRPKISAIYRTALCRFRPLLDHSLMRAGAGGDLVLPNGLPSRFSRLHVSELLEDAFRLCGLRALTTAPQLLAGYSSSSVYRRRCLLQRQATP